MAVKQTSDAEQLPDIPSGTELLDIIWRDLSPVASLFFADLPEDRDSSWATAAGIERFREATAAADRARQEAAATPPRSSLATSRRHRALATAVTARNCTQLLAGALVDGVRNDWPDAAPEQVWLLMAQRLRVLCRGYDAMRQGQAA